MAQHIEPVIPPPPGITSNFEHPHDALHTVNKVTQILCLVVTTVVVIIRALVRIHLHRSVTLEDYATFAGWAMFTGFCACMLVLNKHGGGYHGWDVPKSNLISFQKASYATTIIYVPMVFTVKLALLSVMLRIFAPDRKKVIIIYISLAILVCYYVPALFIKVFFCRPVSAYWLGTDNGGTCINQQKVIIADSAISMISDLWILVLPIPMLWSLNMTVIKKLRVIGMLGAGGLATAFSIWRLQIMVDEGHTLDLTYFWIRAVLTANAEAGIGLICACLPAMSALFATVKNKSSQDAKNSYLRSHELDHWQKISTQKRSRADSFSYVGNPHTDQAHLISTAQGADHDSTWAPSESSQKGMADRPVIHKDVTVSQSYEFVK
ncbi:hypothetical protein BDW42DRAFT_201964 [Aspergillus taichungensis]|uniref:Rhodopsin domain-containing protein n=1 Tax=Aspergillus taichungensis TaxID=482145 RepID=A0A2J5HP14_9EURO|nr:hypothetical protein BDW42DRAFT_201964 [Aspergillus taichungensis]